MSVILAVRGTDTTAYQAGGNPTPKTMGTVTVDAGAGTGIIGNSVINLDQASFGVRALIYTGKSNLPATQQMSVLVRCAMGDTTNALNLFTIGGIALDWNNQARVSAGTTIPSAFNQITTGASLLSANTSMTYTTATYYDLVWLIDGSLTTGAVKIYQDNSLLATANFSATRAAISNSLTMMIALGTQNANTQNQTRIKVNEFVVWDTIIDPNSVALVGGNGALNGASRANFVAATQGGGNNFTSTSSGG